MQDLYDDLTKAGKTGGLWGELHQTQPRTAVEEFTLDPYGEPKPLTAFLPIGDVLASRAKRKELEPLFRGYAEGTLDPAQEARVENILDYQERERSVGGMAAGITSQAIPWMAEYAVTAGALKGLLGAARWARGAAKGASWAEKAAAARKARQAAAAAARAGERGAAVSLAQRAKDFGVAMGRASAQMAVSEALRAPADASRVWARAEEMAFERNFEAGKDGSEYVVRMAADRREASDFVLAAGLDTYIEWLSEGLGEQVLRMPWGAKVAAVQQSAFEALVGKAGYERATKVLRTLGFNGVLRELGEEWTAEGIREVVGQATGLEGLEGHIPSLKENLAMLASFAAIGGGVGVTSALVTREKPDWVADDSLKPAAADEPDVDLGEQELAPPAGSPQGPPTAAGAPLEQEPTAEAVAQGADEAPTEQAGPASQRESSAGRAGAPEPARPASPPGPSSGVPQEMRDPHEGLEAPQAAPEAPESPQPPQPEAEAGETLSVAGESYQALPEASLEPPDRLQQNLARRFTDRPVKFVDRDAPFRGVTLEDGTMVLRSGESALTHELVHLVSQTDPSAKRGGEDIRGLHAEIKAVDAQGLRAARRAIRADFIAEHGEEAWRAYSRRLKAEEAVAGYAERDDVVAYLRLLESGEAGRKHVRRLARENPGLLQRIYDAVRKLLAKLTGGTYEPERLDPAPAKAAMALHAAFGKLREREGGERFAPRLASELPENLVLVRMNVSRRKRDAVLQAVGDAGVPVRAWPQGGSNRFEALIIRADRVDGLKERFGSAITRPRGDSEWGMWMVDEPESSRRREWLKRNAAIEEDLPRFAQRGERQPQRVLDTLSKKARKLLERQEALAEEEATDTLIDGWLADRQESEQEADSRAARHQEELRDIVGRRSVRERLGEAFKGRPYERERAMEAAMHVYIDLRDAEDQGFGTPAEQLAKYGASLSEEQRAIYERSQNLPQPVRELADTIIAENKAQGEEALEAEVLKNVRDNYSARIWESEPIPATAYGKFTKTTARAKARSLESILHGWSLGKELQVKGAIGAQQLATKQVAQAVHDRRMIGAAVKEGLLSDKQQEDDWEAVEHPNFRHWVWVGKAEEGKSYRRGIFISEDGNVFQEVPLYAPKRAARALNNILGKSKLPGWTNWLTKWNAIFKHLTLSLSLFHHQAFLRSYGLGTHGIEGFRPFRAYKEGRQAVLNFEGMTRELVRAGLTIGKVQDFDEMAIREKTAIGKVLDKVPMARNVKNALVAFRDQQVDFLFRRMGAQLKVMGAIHEFHRLLKKYRRRLERGTMTREEIARMAANILNDDFGGLNLQRMRRNPTTQHIFRLLALAPDWTESNVRSMVKAFKGNAEGAAYRRMWARVFVRAGAITVLWQLLMAGMDDDEDFWSMYRRQWEEGKLRWLEVDVTPIAKGLGFEIEKGERKFFSVLGHFRDPVKFVTHPVRSAKHKSSVLGSFVMEAVTGTDWAGRRFTTFAELLGIDDKGLYQRSGTRGDGSTYRKGDPKGGRLAGQTVTWSFGSHPVDYDQLPSFLLAQAKGVMPIQVQNLLAYLAGEMDGFDALTKSMGLMTSTTYQEVD